MKDKPNAEIKADGGTYIQDQLLKRGSLLEALVNNGVEVEFLDPVTFKTIRRITKNGREQGTDGKPGGHQ